jgi:histidyl-tRNA synthetase
MTFKPPKGTRDFLPEEMAKRRKTFETCRSVFEKFGFGEVDTPAFESLDILSAKDSLGEEAVKDIYQFEDKSKRKLGLRYDLTVPIVRLFLSKKFPKPVKWYYINKVWRYEDIKKGRWREFSQCDVEIIGSASSEADAEVLEVAIDCLLSLGLKDIEVRINSRKILDGKAEELGIKNTEDVFRILDKLEKKGEDAVRKEMETIITKEQVSEFLKFVTSNQEEKELQDIINKLPSKYRKYVKIDLSIARGLDYYTGFVFETFIKDYEPLGSVVSGGRYNKLIEKYGGEKTAATGFGLGIDRLFPVLEEKKLLDNEPKKSMFIVTVGKVSERARKLAQELRFLDIPAETDLMGRSLSKQMNYANTKGVPFIIVMGPKEVKSKKAKLRDMESGKERLVSLNAGDIAKKLHSKK